METLQRHCLQCEKPLKGRIDKKFCDDYCRNAYNNKLSTEQNAVMRHINTVLKKNRKILQDVLPDNDTTSKRPKSQLLKLGFRFQYHTHQYTTKKGDTYFYCYDYGYLPLDNEWVLVVRDKETTSG